MNSPIMRILEIAKDMSVSEARQGIQVLEARRRELAGLPCGACGSVPANPYCAYCFDGKELQAGLEGAVRREACPMEHHESSSGWWESEFWNQDIIRSWEDQDCQACEEGRPELHVGYTDDS